jgi:hypothetical protein
VRRSTESAWQLAKRQHRLWAKPERYDREGGIPMDHTTAFTALLTLVSFGFVAAIIFGMI